MKDDVLIQLAVSFGLGLLLGLQRERTERSIAGIRTPLVKLGALHEFSLSLQTMLQLAATRLTLDLKDKDHPRVPFDFCVGGQTVEGDHPGHKSSDRG